MKLFIFIAIIATVSATPVDEKEGGSNIGEPLYQTTDYLYVNDDFNSIQQSGLCLAETNSARARNGKGPLAWDGRVKNLFMLSIKLSYIIMYPHKYSVQCMYTVGISGSKPQQCDGGTELF